MKVTTCRGRRQSKVATGILWRYVPLREIRHLATFCDQAPPYSMALSSLSPTSTHTLGLAREGLCG